MHSSKTDIVLEEYEDEDSSEGSDSEGDDEEPKLKYQRLGDSVKAILERDSATCMTVHEKFLTLGTQSGRVYVLDFNGNETKSFPSHSSTVNAISIDEGGEYLASCSSDGKVVINSLYTTETVDFNFRSPLLSVALDPEYARSKQKSFVCGGTAGTLIRSQKGFWRSSNTPIHSGEGPIFTTAWRGSLIAWANEIGVKIFDVDTNQRITFIERPKGSPRPELYRCCLCWQDDKTLVVGWAMSVQIVVIKERTGASGDLPTRLGEIVARFDTDFYIAGVAPFGDYYVFLAFVEEMDERGKKVVSPPELRIFTRSGEEISGDVLEIRGFSTLQATSYQLANVPAESLFYIVSPKDIVMAKPRDLDDHISWLIDPSRARYKEALEAAEVNESQLKKHKLIDIGEKYLLYLLDTKQAKEAAALCPKILKREAALWERWIGQFAKRDQLEAIGPYIPVGNPVLKDLLYEMVLNHYLKSNYTMFFQLINEWPHTLYNIQNVITAVLERMRTLKPEDNPSAYSILMEALATLYTYNKEFGLTLHIYLRLKRPNAFELISKYNLFHTVQDKVLLLLECDLEKAIALFVTNIDKIPVRQVVEQLQDHPRLQHAYLHALFIKNPHAGTDYHLLAIRLYAEYNYKELMPFLIQTIYPLEKAYKIVEEKQLYPEMVYILGRMGNTKDALDLIIEKIGDVKMAIHFIQEQHDEEDLWETLIDHSMKNPVFVSGLLENIGASEYVKPLDLIKRIPEGMQIVGLRDRLVKIISDYNLQMSLRQGCNSILKADCLNLMSKLDKGQKRGMQVIEENQCPLCNSAILVSAKFCEEVVCFFCSHIYHSRCLKMATHTIEQGGAEAAPRLPEELKYATLKSNQQELAGRISLKGQSLACIICNQNKAKQIRKQQQERRKGEDY